MLKCCVLALTLPFGGPESAAPPSDSVAVAVASSPPRLDGRLDDSVWTLAPPLTQFVQRDPVEGAPATFQTEARVLYSTDALYIGIRAFDPEPASIMAPLARRDARPAGDWLGVMIDPYHDRRTALEFAVNPAGVRVDQYRYDDVEVDPSWDGVWDARVHRDSLGWSAEFRIPLSQLRFARVPGLRFGFNIYREVGRANEVSYWRLLSKQDPSVVSRLGELAGLDALARPSRLELSPYAVGRSGHGTATAWGGLTGGLDARIAVRPGVTLTTAINPDFGQTEVDPAVVNLSSLETFYPERRPLFTESADLFRLPVSGDPISSETLLYTRRIGRAPQLARAGTSAFEVADPTTILGAAKLVGRTRGGWSVGSLTAVTAQEWASGASGEGGGRRLAEPRTAYSAVRASRDFRGGRSQLAGFATLVTRERHPDAARLRAGAVAAGAALSHRPGNGPVLARAFVAVSRVSGTAEALALTQQSSVHYFQRPDQHYARFDPTRTSLSGFAGWVELGRDRGTTTANINWTSLSPGLEVNDLGFLAQAGKHVAVGVLRRRWLERSRFREARIEAEGYWEADWDGRPIGRGGSLRARMTFLNYWTASVDAWRSLGGANPTLLRGGPALMEPANAFFLVRVRTSANRPVRGEVSFASRPVDGGLGGERRVRLVLGWRPAARFELELTPSYETRHDRQQYVGTATVDGVSRYVVGWLHQETLQLGTRANLTVSPALSLQVYAQPFAASGRYPAFAEVVRPGARRSADRLRPLSPSAITDHEGRLHLDLDDDGTADLVTGRPDFAVLSLRSTLVLQWEFRPGSTVAFVVQQNGTDHTSIGGRSPFRALAGLPSLTQRTVAMLKLNYWFTR